MMADDKTSHQRRDPSGIDSSRDHVVRYGCERFGWTEEELKQAVAKAANGAGTVETLLKARWRS